MGVTSPLAARSDGQLLAEVASRGSQESFEEVLGRHDAMVLNVCSRLLGNVQDAEDAAQAVFLLLWKKAASLRRRETVAGWLHEVARRVASNARTASDARRKHEQATSELIERAQRYQSEWDPVKDVLDDEIEHLPEKYKLVVILYHLEDRSLEEVGGLLGLKRATVGTRLSRARDLLRSRLTRRGIGITTASLAAALAANTCAAAVPASFTSTTIQAATLFGAGKLTGGGVLTAKTSALAKGVSHALTIAKLKATAATLLLTSAVAAGGGVLAVATANREAPTWELAEITDAYARQYDTLRSLRAEYDRTGTPLISMKAVFECKMGSWYELPRQRGLVATDRNGRTHFAWSMTEHPIDGVHRWLQQATNRPDAQPEDWTFEELQSALPHVALEEDTHISFFTGEKLIQGGGTLAPRGVERPSFLVRDVSQMKSAHFTGIPLYYSLMAFPCPQMPAEDEMRRKHRVPDMFELASYKLLSKTETIRGNPCVIVEAPGKDVLWLAPKMNFAVVKRRLFFEGALSVEIDCHEFRSVTPEVWLPTRMSETEFAVEGFHPEEYVGRPIVKWDYRFTQLEANSAEHEQLFAFNPEPGSIIIDQTLGQRKTEYAADDSRGTPHISYIAPVNKEDMDEVIAQAVREQGAKDWWPLGFWTTVLLANVAIIAIVGCVLLRRRLAVR